MTSSRNCFFEAAKFCAHRAKINTAIQLSEAQFRSVRNLAANRQFRSAQAEFSEKRHGLCYNPYLFRHILHNLIQCNAKCSSVAFVKRLSFATSEYLV